MIYRFAEFTVDVDKREVHRGEISVAMSPRSLDLLIFLIENRDRAVGKDELQDQVWGTIVTDSALARGVMKLRQSLGDESDAVIKTVPKFGYRFVAQLHGDPALVSETEPVDAPAASSNWLTNKIAIAAVISAAVIAILFFGMQDREPSKQFVPEPSDKMEQTVAVLPFIAMSVGDDDEYFADGLTEELLNSLSRLPDLRVTARTSSFYFKGQDLPIPDIAELLGVAHIVEGSVRRDGNQVRVTAQLIRADDGFHLWSNTYDRRVDGIFEVQTEIASAIATSLGVLLNETQRQRMKVAGLRNAEAYVPYQKAVDIYDRAHGDHRRDDMLREANEYFERSIQLAPDFWRSYYLHSDRDIHYLAATAYNVGDLAYDDERVARAAARAVADLDLARQRAPDEGIRNGIAVTKAFVTGEFHGIRGRITRLTQDSPCGTGFWFSTMALTFGFAEEASNFYRQQRDCDPLNWSGWHEGTQSLIYLGDHDAAIELGHLGVERTILHPMREALIMAYLAAGRFDEAEAYLESAEYDERRSLRLRIPIAAARGDAAVARAYFDKFYEKPGAGAHFYLGYLAQLGEKEKANALAAEIDQRPYGHLGLITNLNFCYCGAAFDLDATPNLAEMLESSGLAWPPPSPIDWPLKQ